MDEGEWVDVRRLHAAQIPLQPQVEMYWTEGGPDYTSPDYQTDWTSWGVKFTDILRNWCRSITAWNLALDERGRPNIGPFSCGGLVTIDSKSNNITRSGQYWAFAHFARNIRHRARRFASEGSLSDLHHVAFSNPDSENVVVLSNSGQARSVTLQLGDSVAQIQLDQKSLATLVWR
jgi:glucosylceramidase